MATETVLPITQNGEFKNVQIKPKWNKKSLKFEGGVQEGEVAYFTKTFKDGKPNSSSRFTNKDGSPVVSYSCRAKDVNGEEVSFWLNGAEHVIFENLGPEGTKFSVESKKETILNRQIGAEMPVYKIILTKV